MQGDYVAEIADLLARLPVRAETGSELDGLRRREAARAIALIIEREKATAIEALTRPASDSVALVKAGLEVDEATVQKLLRVFNHGLIREPDAKNPRGYVDRYKPAEAMRVAIAAIGVEN